MSHLSVLGTSGSLFIKYENALIGPRREKTSGLKPACSATINISNRFNFLKVHGIMNTSGLLLYLLCKRPEVFITP